MAGRRSNSLAHDSDEALRERLASWRACTGPRWLLDAAPHIIAELEAEIERREETSHP